MLCHIIHVELASLENVLNVTRRISLFPIDVSEVEMKLFFAFFRTLDNYPLPNFQEGKHVHLCINI